MDPGDARIRGKTAGNFLKSELFTSCLMKNLLSFYPPRGTDIFKLTVDNCTPRLVVIVSEDVCLRSNEEIIVCV